MAFGEIEVVKLCFKIPKPSAKRLEKYRTFVEEGYYVHWDEPQRKVYSIPNGEDSLEYYHKDESDPDEDVLDGKINYSFFIEYRNETGSRVEKIEVHPMEI